MHTASCLTDSCAPRTSSAAGCWGENKMTQTRSAGLCIRSVYVSAESTGQSEDPGGLGTTVEEVPQNAMTPAVG